VTPEANEYIREYYLKNYNVNISKFSDYYTQNLGSVLYDELSYIFYSTNDPDFNVTLRESFGYNLILVCQFNFDLCNSENLVLTYDSYFGNCYTFNPNTYPNGTKREPSQAYIQGIGLNVFMYTGPPDDEFPYLFDQNVIPKGIIIQIKDTTSNAIMLSGVGVSAGNYAQIEITRTETSNMPYPYGSCIPVESINTLASQQMQQLGITYTRESCLIICLQNMVVNEIGCNYLQYPILPNYPLCRNKTQFDQGSNIYFNMSYCNELCPIECDTVTYDTSVSYSSWPTYDFYITNIELGTFSSLVNNLSYENASKSFACASIYYKEIKYTEITESPSMLLVDLVGAIGGMLGLFLGFSLMVMIELVELVIEFWFIVAKKHFFNKRRNVIEVQPKI